MSGGDISTILTTVAVSYYAAKEHKPRFIAAGMLLFSLVCFIYALPHFIYGAPELLQFTEEHGSAIDFDDVEVANRKLLCNFNSTLATTCDVQEDNNWVVLVLFYCAQLLSGISTAIFFPLGIAYLDENVEKSKAPFLISK